MNDIKTVYIPACEQHEGFHGVKLILKWVCRQCGGPRGDLFNGLSYDGSRRLAVDCWENPCGHVDYYCEVRKEASKNGLNPTFQYAFDGKASDPDYYK